MIKKWKEDKRKAKENRFEKLIVKFESRKRRPNSKTGRDYREPDTGRTKYADRGNSK